MDEKKENYTKPKRGLENKNRRIYKRRKKSRKVCLLCGLQEINLLVSQECFIISKVNGGQYIQENIVQACASCHLSMNSENLITWWIRTFPNVLYYH